MIILCKNQMVFLLALVALLLLFHSFITLATNEKKNLLICRDNSRSDNSPSTSSPTPPEKKSSKRTKTKQKKIDRLTSVKILQQ